MPDSRPATFDGSALRRSFHISSDPSIERNLYRIKNRDALREIPRAARDPHARGARMKSLRCRVYYRFTYLVLSGTPAALNATRRSSHLLHPPQCCPFFGALHVSDRCSGRLACVRIKSSLRIPRNGASIAVLRPSASESSDSYRPKNRGVASGNGLPLKDPMAMRGTS